MQRGWRSTSAICLNIETDSSLAEPCNAADGPYPMPPCICARITSGLTATPQSTAHTTRSTLNDPSRFTVTSATCATKVLNDSCTAIPRPRRSPARPFASGLLHPAFCAASSRTALCRGCLSSSERRSAYGSLPAATASSSTNTSVEYAVCVEPTDLHHCTGTGTLGV